MQQATCSVDGCETRVKARGVCSAHYQRMRKAGPLPPLPPAKGHVNANGYRVFVGSSHPVAGASGVVYEHRAVLHDKIGPGSHPCHWCGLAVSWDREIHTDPDYLTTDHLDKNRLNNDPTNLVPCCVPCNTRRGSWSTHCGWGHEMTPENTYLRPDGKGRNCRTCIKRRTEKRDAKAREQRLAHHEGRRVRLGA